MINTIKAMLQNSGYSIWKEEIPTLYIRRDKDVSYAVNVTFIPDNSTDILQKYRNFNYHISLELHECFLTKIQILNIIFVQNSIKQEVLELAQNISNIWIISSMNSQCYVFENQEIEFDNLYPKVEEIVQQNSFKQVESESDIKNIVKKLTPVNVGLILINSIVFLILYVQGDVYNAGFMYEHGALNWRAVIEGKEYYRLFTCMFLHYGMNHLFNNMVVLLFLGGYLERILGSWKYLIVYLGTGVCSSIVSMVTEQMQHSFTVSAGASGAIFGVVGTLLYVVIRNKGKIEDISAVQLIFMATVTLFHGLTSQGIDNAAHIGGFLAGILIGIIIYHRKKSTSAEKLYNRE